MPITTIATLLPSTLWSINGETKCLLLFEKRWYEPGNYYIMYEEDVILGIVPMT